MRIPKYQIVKDRLKRLALEQDEGYRIPSITELAEQFGVSEITVIRSVKELVAEGFLESIQGAGTFVKKPDRTVQVEDSYNIGLVFTDIVETTHPYLATLIQYISLFAQEKGYRIVFVPEKHNRLFGNHSSQFEEELRNGYYAGLLLLSPLLIEDLSRLLAFGVPFVNVQNEYSDQRIHSVSIDHFHVPYRKIRYCIEQGCQNILFLSGPADMNGQQETRYAYKVCMKEHQLEIQDENFLMLGYEEQAAYEAVAQRFSISENRPDAIVTIDGVLARGAYRALEEHAVSVPKDVVLVQGNQLFTNPALRECISYMDMLTEQVCQSAVDMVVQLINGDEIEEKQQYITPVFHECPAMKKIKK